MAVHVGQGCSGGGSGGSALFYSKIRCEMILGIRGFGIGVVRLWKLLDVLDCFISGIDDIFFRNRCDDEVIGIILFIILFDIFRLEVHRLWV